MMMRPMWVVLGLLLLTSQVTAAGTAAYTRTSSGGGVDVQAVYAPPEYFKVAGDTAGRRRFKPEQQIVFLLTFDTHAGDLTTFNVMKNSKLRTSAGREVAPLRWVATSNSSHHRAGALIFPAARGGVPVAGRGVRSIALIIRNLAGIPRRTLEWTVPPR